MIEISDTAQKYFQRLIDQQDEFDLVSRVACKPLNLWQVQEYLDDSLSIVEYFPPAVELFVWFVS